MGTAFYYDEMHDVPPSEQREGKESRRQVEVFAQNDGLFLRLGPVGDENEGTNLYTARLTSAQAAKLIHALERGMLYVAEA